MRNLLIFLIDDTWREHRLFNISDIWTNFKFVRIKMIYNVHDSKISHEENLYWRLKSPSHMKCTTGQ
jgi:hypothetical protein